MKTKICRTLGATLILAGLPACLPYGDFYEHSGYLPVQGSPHSYKPTSSYLGVQQFGDLRFLRSLNVDSARGRDLLATYAVDSEGHQFTRQIPYRLGSELSGRELRGIACRNEDECIGVGTGGTVARIGGADCLKLAEGVVEGDLNAVAWSPEFNFWIAAGLGSNIIRSTDGQEWTHFNTPANVADVQFRQIHPYSKGFRFLADEWIFGIERDTNGKNFFQLFNLAGWNNIDLENKGDDDVLLLSKFNATGQYSVLEPNANGDTLEVALRFPIFNDLTRDYYDFFLAYESLYLFSQPRFNLDNSSKVQIFDETDGTFRLGKSLPFVVDSTVMDGDYVYLSGRTATGATGIWKSDRNFENVTRITPEIPTYRVKAAERIGSAGSNPIWAVLGDDVDLNTDGIQGMRHVGTKHDYFTIEGSPKTGTINDTAKISDYLYLGVGDGGFGFAHRDQRAFSLEWGLEANLLRIDYNATAKALTTTTDQGEVFSAEVPGITLPAFDLSTIEWIAESPPAKVDGDLTTVGDGKTFFRVADGANAAFDIVYRNTDKSWGTLDVNFAQTQEINTLYFDGLLDKLFIGTKKGLGYYATNGQQGVLPISVYGSTDLNFHHLAGGGDGVLHAVIGRDGSLIGPCPVIELDFKGIPTPTPFTEVIDVVDPRGNPRLISSGDYFGCLGSNGYFGLYPRRYKTWPEFARRTYGDQNVPPLGDSDGNGVSNAEQAVAGDIGFQLGIDYNSDFGRISLPLTNSVFQEYTIQPQESETLQNWLDKGGVFPIPTGGAEKLVPVDSDFAIPRQWRFSIGFRF